MLSNTDTIPWTVSTHTYQGGNWLVVAPSSGNSVPGATPAILTIAANPAGLPVQDYYGTVTLTPTDGKHPPISISIVLNIVPAGTAAPPVVSPAGLVFLGAPGATLKPQTFAITNLTSSPLTFSGAGSTAPKWFAFAPTNGTVNAGQTSTVTVTPNITGLTGGVYPGSIKLTFGDGSTQIVNLLLVLSTSASTSNAPVRPAATPPACTPTKVVFSAELWLWDARQTETWTFVAHPGQRIRGDPRPGWRAAPWLRVSAGTGHDRKQHVDDVHLPGQPGWLRSSGQAADPRRSSLSTWET